MMDVNSTWNMSSSSADPLSPLDPWSHGRVDLYSTAFSSNYDLKMGVLFLFLSILGTFGNLLTILVISRTRRLYNHCTPFLLNMAAGDLMFSSTNLPLVAHNTITQSSFLSLHVCKLASMQFHSLLGISWGSLAAISVVRCIVVRTNGASPWLRKHLLATLILFTWALPMLSIIPLYKRFGVAAHSGRFCAAYCGLNAMRFDAFLSGSHSSTIIVVLTTAFSTIPFIIMTICYTLIFIKMRQSRKNLHDLGVVAFNMQRREQKFSKMLAIIYASYMVCTFPGAVVHLNDGTGYIFPPASIPDWVHSILFTLVILPFSTNPLLYVASDNNYRRAYRDTLCCLFGSNPDPHTNIWRSKWKSFTKTSNSGLRCGTQGQQESPFHQNSGLGCGTQRQQESHFHQNSAGNLVVTRSIIHQMKVLEPRMS